MADPSRLMDESLELGQQELEHLREGNVEAAAEVAHKRVRLMNDAFAALDTVSRKANSDRLYRIQSQLDAIMSEARKLKGTLQVDLGKVRQKGRQFRGYSLGAGIPQQTQGLYHRRG